MRSERISSNELEKLVKEGKIKYSLHRKLKLGRWILKEKIGVLIGSKSKVKD